MNIETAIIDALKLINIPESITLVLADRTSVEPPPPYLLINILTTVNTAMPVIDITHKEGELFEVVRQPKDTVVALTLHAKATDTAQDWFDQFHAGLCADRYNWAFHRQGLGLKYNNEIMYMPQPIDGVAYKRGMFNLTLGYNRVYEYPVNSVTRVETEGNFIDVLNNKTKIEVNVENPNNP